MPYASCNIPTLLKELSRGKADTWRGMPAKGLDFAGVVGFTLLSYKL